MRSRKLVHPEMPVEALLNGAHFNGNMQLTFRWDSGVPSVYFDNY